MKKKDNSQKTQLKNRIKTAHRKARNVGGWYFFGTLLLTVLASFPLLEWTGANHKLVFGVKGVIDYIRWFLPNKTIGKFFVIFVIYIIFWIGMLINLIKSLKQGKVLRQKTWKKSEGADVINGKAEAMHMRAKYYSRAFAAMVNVHLLVALFAPENGNGQMLKLTLFTYIALGVGVLFHFICRIGAAKVSVFVYDDEEAANYNPFQVRKNVCYIEEIKREHGLFRPFIANLLQIVACGALLFLFSKFSVIDAYVTTAISAIKANNFPALVDIKALMQCVLLVFVCILVSHATSAIEYNSDWTDGKGMKKFGIVLFLTIALSVAILVVGGYASNIADVFILIKSNVAIDVFKISRVDLMSAASHGNLGEVYRVMQQNHIQASLQELQQTIALLLAIVAGFIFFLLNAAAHKRKREKFETEEEDVLDADDVELNLEGYINTYAFPTMPAMYAQQPMPTHRAAVDNSKKKKKK